jgi:hypothetical protein
VSEELDDGDGGLLSGLSIGWKEVDIRRWTFRQSTGRELYEVEGREPRKVPSLSGSGSSTSTEKGQWSLEGTHKVA